MSKTINWGILGCGKIADKFAQDLTLLENTKLIAVASRSKERAESFGAKHSALRTYGSYEELVNDDTIDVIYIATRHPLHYSSTMLCLNHNKNVLCEKPFAMNRSEVQNMINLATEKKLFLMEALWSRFLPAIEKMKSLIEEGLIGEVKIIQADFGFKAMQDSSNRLFNKTLGGGSLLDIGIYPLFISQLILGIPSNINANAIFTSSGIDESCGMILKYDSGALAVLYSTFTSTTTNEAFVHGTKGTLKLHNRFHQSSQLSFIKNEKTIEIFDLPLIGLGYAHEIMHVNECLASGLTQSPKMTHQDSLNLIALLDEVRKEIGLKY